MKSINIIIIPQEYNRFNHKYLWTRFANTDDTVIIFDIPADLLVTLIKRKLYRIKDSIKGLKKLTSQVYIFRPFYLIRPDLHIPINHILSVYIFRYYINKIYNKFNTSNSDLNIFFYDPRFAYLLKKKNKYQKNFYYILDELRYNQDGELINSNLKNDIFALNISDAVFTMSDPIKNERIAHNNNIFTVGNGAIVPDLDLQSFKDKKFISFIGNIRNWIDFDLLEYIISSRPNYLFKFVGPIEDNIKNEFNKILSYINVYYEGEVSKELIGKYYMNSILIIVPYKKNNFINATRPIKIVEAIFHNVPVVSVPVQGYFEFSYLKFASTNQTFLHYIDMFINNEVILSINELDSFKKNNSWDAVATKIKSNMLR